jgi:hypothetical protein
MKAIYKMASLMLSLGILIFGMQSTLLAADISFLCAGALEGEGGHA